MNQSFCIIGAGTYGSYLANALSEQFPESKITIIEVGDNNIKSEKEIGFLSRLSKRVYKASSDGRYFGLGGTSAKWGGQLLFFGKDDFQEAKEMEAITNCNIKYKSKVLSRFFPTSPELIDENYDVTYHVKQGIWLKFQQRNMFTLFKLDKRANIEILTNRRVVKLNIEAGSIVSILLKSGEKTETFIGDVFYLTAGALESLRLLHESGIKRIEESRGFSDHISMRCFEIHSTSGKVGPFDFQFRFNNGSMKTTRLTGEVNGTSYYIHPIFNESFILFQLLKQLIFKGQFSVVKLVTALRQIFSFFPFAYNYFINKKLFIYQSWFLNVDIELEDSNNVVRMLSEKDKFGENGIDIGFDINQKSQQNLIKIKEKLRELLNKYKIPFSEINSDATSLKLEDVYHPYGLIKYKEGQSIYNVYHPLNNLYLFNTGILKRSGPINPTAALFCLIEDHVDKIKNDSTDNRI